MSIGIFSRGFGERFSSGEGICHFTVLYGMFTKCVFYNVSGSMYCSTHAIVPTAY